jgi:outer membrane protein OmpA-like peptidoglycan-associated protein
MRFALLGPVLLIGATISAAEGAPLRIAQNAENPDVANPNAQNAESPASEAQPTQEQAAPPPPEEGAPKKERRARGKRPDAAQEAPDAGAAEAEAEAQRQEAERAARQQQEEAEKAAAAKAQQDEEAAKAAAKAQQDEEAAKAAAAKAHQDDEAAKAAAAAKAQQDEESAKEAAKRRHQDADKGAPKAAGPQAVLPADGETKRRAFKGRDEPVPAARGDLPPAAPPATAAAPASSEAKDARRENPTKRLFRPANEKQAVEQLKQEGVRADEEFEKAKREAATQPQASGEGKRGASAAPNAARFEQVRKQRRQRVEDGGQRAVIEEPDKRRIIIEKDRAFVRHDETERFSRTGKRVRQERQKDGTILSVYLGLGGVEILTLEDDQGRLLRRSRKGRDGRENVLIDNRQFYRSRPRGGRADLYVDLPAPSLRIARDKYIVDYDEASEEDVYEALSAPPVERLDRGYSMEEVRYGRGLRERMRRVDLDAITFAFGSWEVEESQYSKLERVALAFKRILKRNPDEMFLIEGHTDAVGSDIDNLSLSDRRAESVAIILSDEFRVPPENLTTQGYGEQYLKELTNGPSRQNRRVAVRRITPLLSRAD